jgi:hypothetical protein
MNQLGFPLYMNGQAVQPPSKFRHDVPNATGYSAFYMNDKEVRGPVTLQHWPTAGVGEYFSEPLGQSIAEFAAFQRPRSTLRKVTSMSPLLSGIGAVADASAGQATGGEGGAEKTLEIMLAVVVVGLVVRGVAGYYVGKAMAPRGRESKYAWGGAAASVLLGTLGLGVEAGVALSNK